MEKGEGDVGNFNPKFSLNLRPLRIYMLVLYTPRLNIPNRERTKTPYTSIKYQGSQPTKGPKLLACIKVTRPLGVFFSLKQIGFINCRATDSTEQNLIASRREEVVDNPHTITTYQEYYLLKTTGLEVTYSIQVLSPFTYKHPKPHLEALKVP